MNFLLEIEAIITAILSGAQYGFKIRFPHAVLMTFLFRRDLSLQKKITTIITLTLNHSYSLAKFAGVYKIVLLALKCISQASNQRRRLNFFNYNEAPTTAPGYPQNKYHSFIAGAIGGYIVWGKEYSPLNYQIVLYLTSRVLVGCIKGGLRPRCYPPTLNDAATSNLSSSSKFNVKNREFDDAASGELSSLSKHIIRFVDQNGYPLSATIVWALVMTLFENSPSVLHPSLRLSMEEIYRPPMRVSSLLRRRLN